MPNWKQIEREEDQLCEDLNAGLITQKEYNENMRQMHADIRAEAEEAADDARDRVMNDWGY